MYPVICVILVKQAMTINPIQNTLYIQLILVECFRPLAYAGQWTLNTFQNPCKISYYRLCAPKPDHFCQLAF